MASKPTEYERLSVENIRRNEESLKIKPRLHEITSAKRKRVGKKISPAKEKEPDAIRRSGRIRGIRTPPVPVDVPASVSKGPLKFRDSYSNDTKSDAEAFTKSIRSISNGIPNTTSNTCDFELHPENIARVVDSSRVYAVKFFPTQGLEMIAVGNEFGNLGFWNMKTQDKHLFNLHSDPISGILIHPFSISKVYTSSYDGMLRAMNIEKQVFDLVYSASAAPNVSIYSVAQKLDDANSIYMGEGQDGVVNLWDGRMRKIQSSWNLHKNRINSIDFKPSNTMIMATSSTDGNACIWDLRKMSVALREIEHERAVHSAYFSPSSTHLATTSIDNTIVVATGRNFEDISLIPHVNPIGRRTSKFKAIWGWDDKHLYVGNMSKGVDIVSVRNKETLNTLKSKLMTTIPCRFDAHPCKAGALAGAATGGQVYVWTPPS